jgi:hypothetical protein
MISYYTTVRNTTPEKTISMNEFIQMIRGEEFKEICEEIRKSPDKETRQFVKQKLPAVTPSGVFSKRSIGSLKKHSGLVALDMDIDDNEQLSSNESLTRTREYLCLDPIVHFLFKSPSGGMKVGVLVEESNEKHVENFENLAYYFLSKYGLVCDKACRDVSRLCFVSHDPDAFLNPSSIPYQPDPSTTSTKNNTPVTAKNNILMPLSDSPGDQFNAKVHPSTLLVENGWSSRDGKYWTRPGKTSGISGTLGIVGENVFFCFSSNAAPLEANTSYTSFALFTYFNHNGDFKSALKELNKNGLNSSETKISETFAKSIRNLIEEAIQENEDKWKEKIDPEVQAAIKKIEEKSESDGFLASLKALRANSESTIESMKKRAKEAVFVLPDVALSGDSTLINASPNTGKTLITLWLLSKGNIKDKQIFYINADDSFNGSIEKMEVMNQFGVNTLIPNENQFNVEMFEGIIKGSIKTESANQIVFVLDTLKKFCSTMSKEEARNFTSLIRGFTQAGGTVIALAHTNKMKDNNGKSIAEGVSDFESDFDCAYTIERSQSLLEGDRRIVCFENRKNRGPNSLKITFSYDGSEKKSWTHRFNSVQRQDTESASILVRRHEEESFLKENKSAVDFLLSKIQNATEEPISKSALEREDIDLEGSGSRSLRAKILSRFSQRNEFEDFQLWEAIQLKNGGTGYKPKE